MRAMKLGQFRRRMREIILPFEMNLWNLHFSWLLNSFRIFKQVPIRHCWYVTVADDELLNTSDIYQWWGFFYVQKPVVKRDLHFKVISKKDLWFSLLDVELLEKKQSIPSLSGLTRPWTKRVRTYDLPLREVYQGATATSSMNWSTCDAFQYLSMHNALNTCKLIFECKTNTSTILMHQMRISTTQVSSVMLRSKRLEIRKKMWKLKEPSDEN
jgi:hypothetical protein